MFVSPQSLLPFTASLLLLWASYPAAVRAGPSSNPKHRQKPAPPPIPKPQPPGEAVIQDEDYNKGSYGNYVTQYFKTANITAPRLNMMHPFTNCDDGSYLLFTPRGEIVNDTTATIYDASGSLIWKLPDGEYKDVYNFDVQQFNGKPHLTFWSGDPSGGHGEGYYYVLDQQYKLVRRIDAGNGLSADLHSMTILPDGYALVTVYMKMSIDMHNLSIHPSPGPQHMWDCLFQEVNIDTREVRFQWRASDHFDPSMSYAIRDKATEEEPWDFFHINSVEKDAAGNYLISSRHMRCIAYISGETGEMLWQLGGRANNFKRLGSDFPTRYVGQHDAHFDEGGKFVTMFDNRADWYYELEHVSKGRRIEIDTEKMTAKENATYIHPDKIFAFSQGSYQTLPSGNVFLGYGFTGAMTEFHRNGTVLCDAYFQPSSRFSSGDVQSYRNLKRPWIGLPDTPPSALIENNTLYVSWLGSTEVRSWWLQDSTTGSDDRWAAAGIYDKSGFETLIPLDSLPIREYIRIVALDAEQQPLSTSLPLHTGELATVFEPVTSLTAVADAIALEQRWHSLGTLSGYAILAVVLAAIVFFISVKVRRASAAKQEQGGGGTVYDKLEGVQRRSSGWWRRIRLGRSAAGAAYAALPQVEDTALRDRRTTS